jgi:lysophospholipase
MGYVDDFKNYVSDLELFLSNLKLELKCEKKFLLAHSLAAGVGTVFILDNPTYFDKVAMTSPMLKIKTRPYTYPVARAIVQAAVISGRGAKFAVNQKGFNPNATFEDNTFTTSPARFKMAMLMFQLFPVTKLGGVSNKWVLEIMKGTNEIRSRYNKINVPIRLFHAGIELYSESSEMIKFCDEVSKCKRILFPTSKHEVLMDRDETRKVILESLGEFFM